MGKDVNISFRVSKEERAAWQKRAAALKMKTSGWMRRTLNAAMGQAVKTESSK